LSLSTIRSYSPTKSSFATVGAYRHDALGAARRAPPRPVAGCNPGGPGRLRDPLPMSEFGTKRTFYACRRMSVLGGKAVMQRTSPQRPILTRTGHRLDRNPAAQQSPPDSDVLRFRSKRGRDRPVNRRSFITMVGGAAAAWPLGVRAQQPVFCIGYLSATSAPDP
jgi:hypothetical protein